MYVSLYGYYKSSFSLVFAQEIWYFYIYIGVSLIYPRWYFAYIQNNDFFFSGFAQNLCISLYRRNNAFSSYIQEIDTFSFQFLPQNLYVFLIYVQQEHYFSQIVFLYIGKTILFLYIDKCLFFVLPQNLGMFIYMVFSYRGISIYIQEPLSFLYIAQGLSVSYIYSKTIIFLCILPINIVFLYIQLFSYIYSIDTPFLFSFCPEVFLYIYTIVTPLYIYNIAYIDHFSFLPCPDFPYIWYFLIYRINTSFLFYLAQKCVFSLYIIFVFSLIQLFLFLYMFCPSILYIQLIAFIFSYIVI